jgi:hypothetical protein
MQSWFMQLKYSIVFCLLIIWACGNKKSENKNATKDLFSTDLPLDFVAFYKSFHEDSVFQIKHIVFPLEGAYAISEEGDIVSDTFRWQKEDWKIMHTPDMMDGTFVAEFTNMNGIVTETIMDKNHSFSMVRRFAKLSDEWNLIYYKEMGK